jgi:hypothetical protein
MEARGEEGYCKGLRRNKWNLGLRIYTPIEDQRTDPTKRQEQFPHSMPLPNCSLEIHTYRHVSAIHSLTAYHAAHYHAVSASSLKRCTPTGGKEGSRTDTSRRRNHGL